MDLKKSHIYKLAVFLNGSKSRMTVADLAMNLNANAFMTSYGTRYQGLRGTYTLLHNTYKVIEQLFGPAQAALIAHSSTRPD